LYKLPVFGVGRHYPEFTLNISGLYTLAWLSFIAYPGVTGVDFFVEKEKM
jgi:hypothetical protein